MIRTLIVDNNVTRAGLTGRAVRELKFGATVNYALSTVQALFYIAGILADRSKILPDIIVLTIPMPDTKGVDAVKALAESVAIHSVSIIVVNDSQECQDSMQYYKHGAAAMISKSSDAGDYRQSVADSLSFTAMVMGLVPTQPKFLSSGQYCEPTIGQVLQVYL